MSASIQKLVLAKAVELWSDPKHRCMGAEYAVAHNTHEVYDAYCAIGVLKQAYQEITGETPKYLRYGIFTDSKRVRKPSQKILNQITADLGFTTIRYMIHCNDTHGPNIIYEKMRKVLETTG